MTTITQTLRKNRYIPMFLLGGIIFTYIFIYWPLINLDLTFANEYLNIPQPVVLEGGTFDSIRDINKIKALAMRVTDFREVEANRTIERPHLKITDEQSATDFLKNIKGITTEDSFYYDRFARVIVSRDAIVSEHLPYLKVLAKKNSIAATDLGKFLQDTEKREALKKSEINDTDQDLIFSLDFHFLISTQQRWMFAHHVYVYGGANYGELAGSYRVIPAQYGIVSQFIIAQLAKLLGAGEFNLNNYFHASNILYISYFLIFLLAFYLTTESLWWAVLAGLLFIGARMTQDYEYIFLGPGINPVRHFFDVFVLICIFFYSRNNSLRWLVACLCFCLFNFFLNPERGLFCSASIYGLFLFKFAQSRKWSTWGEITSLFFFAGLHIAAYFWLKGVPQVAHMNLSLHGYFAAPMGFGKMTRIVIPFVLSLFLAYKNSQRSSSEADNNLLIFSTLYAFLSCTYYVVQNTYNHLVILSPIFIMPVIFFLKSLEYPFGILHMRRILLGISIAVVIFVIGSAAAFIKSKKKYFESIRDESFGTWTFKGANINSSIPEEYFRSAIKLLKEVKSLQNNDAGIFLISQYDNILPIISGTFNRIPTFDLAANLSSQAEFDKYAKSIELASPEFIVTDKTILSPITDELIDQNVEYLGAYALESYMRVERQNLAKMIFSKFRTGYQPLKTEGFLTVWKKNAR